MAARDPGPTPDLVEESGERDADAAATALTRESRTVESVVLRVYLLVLMWVVLLKIHTDDFGDLAGRRSINVVPFGGTGAGGLGTSELAVNVLAFIPLGVLVYLATQRRTLLGLLFPTVGVSLALEIIQYAAGIGASDVTDILTNSAGGLIGVGLAWLTLRLFGHRAQRWLLVTLVIVLVALAVGFFAWLQVTGIQFRL